MNKFKEYKSLRVPIYFKIYIYTHTHTYIYIYIYVCVCVCVCVCVYIKYINRFLCFFPLCDGYLEKLVSLMEWPDEINL